jgi:hypothetical protein
VVGEPRQCEVLDFLGVGARCDRIEFTEPGLLLAGAPCSLRCQVGVPPRMQEGTGELRAPAPAGLPILFDFWTAAYQAIDDD